MNSIRVIFFDLGDTLGKPVLSDPPASRLTGFQPFPFVPDLLASLVKRGLRLGIISNTGDTPGSALDEMLSRAGMVEFFEPALRIYSQDVGLRKDSSAIFTLAIERTGIDDAGGHCLFVGEDAAERAFAVEAGMKALSRPSEIDEVVR